MPMLLEDLAEETLVSIRRAADRLGEEAKELDDLRHAAAGIDHLRWRIVESARQATSYALSRVPQAEAVWQSAIVALRKQGTGEEAKRLLRSLRGVFEAGRRLCQAPRDLWALADALGVPAEQVDTLDQARHRFEVLAAEAGRALEHREGGWQPADAGRLAVGLQLGREGKTIKADDARARFRRS